MFYTHYIVKMKLGNTYIDIVLRDE